MLHKSVLLNECIDNLHIKSDGIYVDATLGYGGHSEEILKKLTTGFLYCFDQDIEAIKASQERLSKVGNNFKIIKSNFANITEKLEEEGISKVDGIIFDLGVSSPQLDNGERGFSYHQEAILDMRMDKDNKLDAKYVVNKYEYNDLVRILRDYGDEKYASSIAKNIIKYRSNKVIETTLELVDIIKSSMPARELRDGHPAKRAFQAIRIEVNHELEVLNIALEKSIKLLTIGGRLCVISFHSKEDSIVKRIFKKYSEIDASMKMLPFVPEKYLPKIKVIESNITASNYELEENNRARSAKLRVIEKIKE